MRLEGHALLLDAAQLCQRKDLKSAAIGQNRLIPIHKLVNTAELTDQLVARSYVKVIGVGKLDLTANLAKIVGRYAALDGGTGADVHKYGRFSRSVDAFKMSAARLALGFQYFKHSSILFRYVLLKNFSISCRDSSKAIGLPCGQ